MAMGSMHAGADRSSLFMCLFCSRNANLCDPYYACYPGSAGGGHQSHAAASLVGAMTEQHCTSKTLAPVRPADISWLQPQLLCCLLRYCCFRLSYITNFCVFLYIDRVMHGQRWHWTSIKTEGFIQILFLGPATVGNNRRELPSPDYKLLFEPLTC